MRALALPLVVGAVTAFSLQASSQQVPRDEEHEPLVLDRLIPMPSVQGRIDHMTVDAQSGRIFAAVYGNDTAEVLDVHRAREIAVIRGGLDEPQGVAFLPELNRIVITSDGGGTCTIFDATSYARVGAVSFGDDADQIRYDAPAHRLYVGYGDGTESAIGMIDTQTWTKLPQSYRLDAHPESFQVDDASQRIFVNIASRGEVQIIHLDTGKIETWKLPGASENFPMALDLKDHRIFVAARRPARMMVLDSDSGAVIASLPGADDTDDMWYDATRRRIYEPSGEGFIFVFQQVTPDIYDRVAKIPTAIGARTSAYFGQVGKHNDLYLAVPPSAGRGAEMWVFETRD